MAQLAFAMPVSPGEAEREAVLLARSQRAFGGALRQAALWALLPNAAEALTSGTREALSALGVELVPFPIADDALRFPFAVKAFAAAAAEEFARGRADILVWMDADTLVLQEPGALLLASQEALGCCPIHHLRIGPPYDTPLGPFWRLIYDQCAVPEERAFLLHTVVDGERIRPHLNAGLLAVRPERGLLRAWRDNFTRLYRQPAFQQFYAQNGLYRIFVHQAILSGTVLSLLTPAEIRVLPLLYNYPLHLHAAFPPERAVARLNDLVTCRYDGWEFLARPGWQDVIRIEEPLKAWLEEQVS
jgi:hypothetical protein